MNAKEGWLDAAGGGPVAAPPGVVPQALTSALWAASFELAPAGLMVSDPQGRVVAMNRSAETLLDVSREALVGADPLNKPWTLIDHCGLPLDAHSEPAMRTLHSGEALSDCTMCLDLPDGRCRWLSASTALLPRDDGLPWVLTQFVDVSASHAAEALLVERAEQLRAALASSRTVSWHWNVRADEWRADDHLNELLGHAPDAEPIRQVQQWRALIHVDDLIQVLREQGRCFAGETPGFDLEYRVRNADGAWLWMRDRGQVIRRQTSGLPDLVMGTIDDVTERKRAEQTAKLAHELLDGLFQLSPIGILLTREQDASTVMVNPALAQITGYSPEELMGSVSHQAFLPSLVAQRREWGQALASAGAFGPVESETRHKSGKPLTLAVAGLRVSGAGGEPYVWTMAQDVTPRKALERELIAAANEDRLTGLPNRAHMMRALGSLCERALAEPTFGFAVLFLDFDRFKLINDILGHDAGDELLRGVSVRLREVLAEQAKGRAHAGEFLVARIGGDEFVVLAPGMHTEADVRGLGDALLNRLALPYTVSGKEVNSSASIGVALSRDVGAVAHTLLRDADTAMYEAKRLGRRTMVFFDESMRLKLTRAVLIEGGLRHALLRNEMNVLYQPIVDLNTGKMTSAEALLRWHCDDLGDVSPSEFIPIAEESGHIIALGDWVLRQACLQWQRWQQQDGQAAPASVSVNLSRVQMSLGPELLRSVREALAQAGMPPTALQLEITEREVMKDSQGSLKLISALRDMGVRLAMDDFGTGASSLGCLRDFPFDCIKIDRSFVTDLCRNPHVMAVAHATVSVIENLGMVSVAEGIEGMAEVAALQAMGCRYGQGYLFARPQPADRLLTAMAPYPVR